MSSSQKAKCFVICPIGEAGSETRKRSDKVLNHIFQPALGDHYEITRADKISEPGMITSQILRALQDSDLVIADLTEHNANVFYELAVRHAVEKSVIHVIDSRWKIPFDVAGFRTIVFDFTDLDSVAEAIKELKRQVAEVQSGKRGETPIKIANVLRPTTADSEDTLLLKEAVQGISTLRSDVAELSSLVAKQGETIFVNSVPVNTLTSYPLSASGEYLQGTFGTGKSALWPGLADTRTTSTVSTQNSSSPPKRQVVPRRRKQVKSPES